MTEIDPGRFPTENIKQVRILDNKFKFDGFHADVTLCVGLAGSVSYEWIKVRGRKMCSRNGKIG
jgi:hypothetical protein